jgi:Mn2+/Fe2+ NRAMP family transporter
MLILTNDREVMGEYINSRWFNNVAWVTVLVMIVLTLALTVRRG